MTDKESGQNIQFLILPSTIAVVDKGTSLHCYYVKMCRTGVICMWHLFYTFLHNSSEGMFLCLPQQLLRVEWGTVYFVRHVHSVYLSCYYIVQLDVGIIEKPVYSPLQWCPICNDHVTMECAVHLKMGPSHNWNVSQNALLLLTMTGPTSFKTLQYFTFDLAPILRVYCNSMIK